MFLYIGVIDVSTMDLITFLKLYKVGILAEINNNNSTPQTLYW